MKFAVQHTTVYQYSSQVRDSFNDVRLCPVSDNFQKCLTFGLTINPQNTSVLRRLDFYTNQVHHFEVMEPHASLEVVAQSEVETFADVRDFSVASLPERLEGLGHDERYYDFLAASPRVSLTPMIEHEAKEIVDRGADVQGQAMAVMNFIFTNFAYAPGSTSVESDVMQVFSQKRGVCQDFAHVMSALCRSIGIPTRYVSGYFYVDAIISGSADDNTESHAWVECFIPAIGWVGYDPTHNRRVDDTYIKVAVGRDYVDVRPLAGTFRGEAIADLSVAVKIDRLA